MTEGILLCCQSFLHCTIIDSPKVTHIERNGVHAYLSGFQVSFIHEHHVRTDAVKRNILLVPECHKAFKRGSIGLGRAYFTQLFQLSYDTMHKGKEGGLLGQFMEHGDHVICREATTLRFQ